MPIASIVNALVRCTRQDHEADGLFELVRPDLGLWVLELDYTDGSAQAEQIDEISRQLQAHSFRLQRLREGSSDFALHLTFYHHEHERVILPPTLSRLASECGFYIELYIERKEDD